MRVIITGGTGLIGRALAESLVADHHEVIIVSRGSQAHKDLPGGVEIIDWTHQTLVEHLERVDVVVNLAGASIAGESLLNMRWTAKRKKLILESRLDAGKKISEALKAAKKKPKVLIQSSAIGFYGALANEIVDENYPKGDGFLANVCQDWENSTKSVDSLGIRRVIIRTSLVFSERGGIFPLLKLPFSLFIGGPLGNGRQYLSWIHIDDMVKAIRFLIDNEEARGIFNLSSPNPVTNITFAKDLGKATKRPALLKVPAIVMKFILGEASTLALDGQRVIPNCLVKNGFSFKYETLEHALSSLLNPIQHFK